MSTPEPSTTTHERALVLAGAGAAGNAWELGLVAGLAAAGVDVIAADLVVGTSAGSTVAAQITSGARPEDLYAAVVAETPPARPGTPRTSAQAFMDWSDAIIASSTDAADMRRRMGAAALERDTPGDESTARWRRTVAARLPSPDWPAQLVRIVAVDAHTGDPVVLDSRSGVDLVDAVAASTSNGFAGTYRIGARRLVNGGYRRNENADLAAGYRRVLVLSPFGGRTRHPLAWRMDLAAQVDELRAGGSSVEVVVPSASAGDVFNAAAMDPSTRPRAARSGYGQGQDLAERLATFWG